MCHLINLVEMFAYGCGVCAVHIAAWIILLRLADLGGVLQVIYICCRVL